MKMHTQEFTFSVNYFLNMTYYNKVYQLIHKNCPTDLIKCFGLHKMMQHVIKSHKNFKFQKASKRTDSIFGSLLCFLFWVLIRLRA